MEVLLSVGICGVDARTLNVQKRKVFDMVLALPKVASVKATKILHSRRISPSKTFGGLSECQRAELAGRLKPVAV